MKVYLLIDQSGSMARNWTETIGAVNSYIRGLSENQIKGLRFNVAAFDSDAGLRFTELRRDVKPGDWGDITNKDAEPRGMTPLFDAIGKLAGWVSADKPKRATVAIITDGEENASREVKKSDAKAMLDKMREQGFDVVFLGADFDAFGEAASVGVAAGQTLNMTAGNYGAAMAELSTRTTAYASSGLSGASWSAAARRRAAGK